MIELLIVVAIILIIAAIAIPNLLKSIGTANVLYSALFNRGFAGTLAQLGPAGGSCATVGSGCADLLDSLLSGVSPSTPTPTKSGYTFAYAAPNASPTVGSPNANYSAVATPAGPGSTGVSSFCVDGGNVYVIWRDTSGGATSVASDGCTGAWTPGGTIGPL